MGIEILVCFEVTGSIWSTYVPTGTTLYFSVILLHNLHMYSLNPVHRSVFPKQSRHTKKVFAICAICEKKISTLDHNCNFWLKMKYWRNIKDRSKIMKSNQLNTLRNWKLDNILVCVIYLCSKCPLIVFRWLLEPVQQQQEKQKL